MPRGYPISADKKSEILKKLQSGTARAVLAQEYKLHPKTLEKWEEAAASQRRTELKAQGSTVQEIEQMINQEFRGDNAVVRSFEYQGEFKKEFLYLPS